MFGFTTISIDAKGRLAIPAKYRDQLLSQNEDSIVVTRDPQYPALKIYPGSIWNSISIELQSLQGLDPIVRNLQWTILGNASVSSFDPKGRMLILLPLELREYAEIKKADSVASAANKLQKLVKKMKDKAKDFKAAEGKAKEKIKDELKAMTAEKKKLEKSI